MIISAKKESFNFYANILRFGGFIEVGTLNNKWIKVDNLEMLKRFYEADCLLRIPFTKDQPKISDVNVYSDLSKEEQEQLSLEAECTNPND